MAYLRRLTEPRAPQRRYGTAGRGAGAGRLPADRPRAAPSSSSSASPATSSWCGTSSTSAGAPNIYCQGRGSAANSAVCYALGITNADAVALGLLFERFLSPERDGPPDIDIDIESGRREEAIQYVYAKHGRRHAAQVANVITYRAKSSIRDMAKALGYAPGQQDAWSKQVDAWGGVAVTAAPAASRTGEIPADVLELAAEVEHAPRHLGIHSGGMVICDRPIVEVCPVEWARMEDRSVLQWDKDDCAAIGLVKFDLLGLGMLEVLHGAHRPRAARPTASTSTWPPSRRRTRSTTCSAGPTRSACSRWSPGPRWPRCPGCGPATFYDLVVEVALIRPGPIQGGSVHPYIRRRNGKEPVTYLHPLLETSLEKTLGIPLFQEQLMQMAIDVGGFSPGRGRPAAPGHGLQAQPRAHGAAAPALRRRGRRAGRHARGDREIWEKLAAFASYGFPESHSVSLRLPRLRVVVAEALVPGRLLRRPAQRPADGLLLAAHAGAGRPPPRRGGAHPRPQRVGRHRHPGARPTCGPAASPGRRAPQVGCRRRRGGAAGRRCGWASSSVRGIGDDLAERDRRRPALRRSRRTWPAGCRSRLPQLEALATAGAFDCFGLTRREALWAAGAVAQVTAGRGGAQRLPGIVTGVDAPAAAGHDRRRGGPGRPVGHRREPRGPPHPLRPRAPRPHRAWSRPRAWPPSRRGSGCWWAGWSPTGSGPATAGGTLFVNLEDETGLINVVVSKGCWTAPPPGGPHGARPCSCGAGSSGPRASPT